MKCFYHLRNIQDLLSDGKTPYERRFGEPKKGPIIPFGSLVEYYPISAKDQSRIHQFGKKVLPELFPGYALHAGGILEGLHAGCRHWGVGNDGSIGNLLEKFRCKKRWYFPKRMEKFILSVADGRRRSGTENIHLDTGPPKSRRRSKSFSWRIRRVSSTTSWLISWCRWNEKWLLVHVRKLHIPPSRWTQSQTLLVERRIIPYSTEIHWRLQNYTYKLGCYGRKPHRWQLEYRWIKRFVWFLYRFHPVYFLGRKTSRRICVVRVRD